MIYNRNTAQTIIDEINESENIPTRDVGYEYNDLNGWHLLKIDGNVYQYHNISDVINTLMLIQDNFWVQK